ncbi:BrnT family toxin [Alcanivorax sp. S71-1-4]|uniref:BrnT family toxin n=1 Tax=Alcanivorax sp. S71-1-4 TaxID=1177159 RepID=UPI00135A562D|nr:BrnT family toxin [Alcanivorax sp. S71-1-4]
MLGFSWDAAKAHSNLKKHGVSFEEARSVFYDEFAMQFEDDSHSGEQRFLLLGMSRGGRVLVVVHCERGPDGEELRIISARRATGRERQHYQGEPL